MLIMLGVIHYFIGFSAVLQLLLLLLLEVLLNPLVQFKLFGLFGHFEGSLLVFILFL